MGISLLLHNCQDENTEVLFNQNNHFEQLFDVHSLSEQLDLGDDNIYIDWHNPEVLEINKTNKGGIYQYDIKFREEPFNTSDLFISKIFYKLIVNEKQDDLSFIVLRFEPFKNSINISPSESNLKDFSGMKFIYNKEGIAQDIYTYIKGEKIASFNDTKPNRKGKNTDKDISLSKASSADYECLDLNGNYIPGCKSSGGDGGSGGGGYAIEYTRNYTDWYNKCNSCDSKDGQLYFH